MGVFEKLPYLNYHDINLDWLVKQTKKNASDNTKLMKIFKDVEDQGIIGVVTDVTENPDNTVKIDYYDNDSDTFDDFTVYDKTGADNAISGAQSAAESYADNAIANAFKGLGDLPAETDLQNTDLLLINRSGAAEAIAGDVVAKQSDMSTAQGDITNLQTDKVDKTSMKVVTLVSGDTIAGTVNNMPENSRNMIIQNGLAVSDAPITSSTYFIYTVEKGANNRIYIEATVNGGGVAYEHYFAIYSGSGSITWRRYVETPSSFVMNPLTTSAGSNSFNVASGSRHLVAFIDSDANRNGLYLVWATGAGNVGYVTVQTASGLTITTTTNTFTVDTGSGTPVGMDFWIGTRLTHN